MTNNFILQCKIAENIYLAICQDGNGAIENRAASQKLQFVLPSYDGFSVQSCEVLDQGTDCKHIVIHADAASFSIQRDITVYLDSAILESVDTLHNNTDKEIPCALPHLFDIAAQMDSEAHIEMLTGGGNFTGSHILRDETPPVDTCAKYCSNEKPKVIRVDGIKKSKRKFVEGTSVWQEFFAIRSEHSGFHVTFDYAGIWNAAVMNEDGSYKICVFFPDEQYFIPANSSLTLPVTRLGAYSGDLDALGNHILNFSYRHKWEYTNPAYLAKTNAFMFWINDAHTSMPQCENAFWMVRNAQTIGAEIIHIDDFWYDKKGNWNNIALDNFEELNLYANKCGLKLSIWYAPWHADFDSEPFKRHKAWRVRNDKKQWYGGHFDMSNDDACAWQKDLMESKQTQWGSHMIKYDGEPLWPSGGSLKLMPKASENWYHLLRSFRESCPDAGVFGCASGGELMGIEALQFSDLHCVTDELVGHYNGYYNSIITPPDKIMGGGKNVWGKPYCPESRSEWKTEVQINMNQANAATNTEDIEFLRQDVERYRYFHTKGCVGHGVQIFRPICAGMDQTFALQKMSADLQCGYITLDTALCPQNTPVTVYPKGMLPDQMYTLRAIAHSFEAESRLGKEWMRDGIYMDSIHVGEMICVNLEDMPNLRQKLYFVPDPLNCEAHKATIMGHTGMAVSWTVPAMRQWYSYAAILCDGKRIAQASVGEYCFLPEIAPHHTFEVQLFDGYGNCSNAIMCV